METLNQNFKSETKTIKFLLKGLFFIIHLAIMTEIVAGIKFRLGLRLVFFLYFSKPYYKTITNRYYTYWSFSIFILAHLGYKVYEQYFELNQSHIGALYLAASIVLIIKMYILSSPIYYPRVSWWEYDFRYKDDLKIKIIAGENEYKARLTDLRRLAGCIGIFEELKLGEEIIISANIDETVLNLRGQVMTKRKEIIGRPTIYGIMFKFDSRSNKKRYKQLVKLWNKDKNFKKKLKMAHV